MLEDRRHSSRHPVLLRSLVTYGGERLDVVCTDTSTTGGFFTARTPPPLGAEVVVELRAGGLDGPIVTLHAVVTRTSLAGSQGAIGFGVAWRTATSESGPEPLHRVLRNLLGIQELGDTDLTQGRSAGYVFRDTADAAAFDPAAHAPPVPHRASHALGVWSTPMHRPTSGTPEHSRQPVQHPVELDPQAPPVSRPVPAPARPSSPINDIFGDKSVFFDALDNDISVAVGATQETSAQSGDDSSQSWPVYALAPSERRAVSDPEQIRPVLAPTAQRTSVVVAPESIAAPPSPRTSVALHRHPSVPMQPISVASQPVSTPFAGFVEHTAPSAPPSAKPRRQDSARLLAAADVPITYLRENQFYAGQLTGIAEQLACVVTQGVPPGLDEVLVIHLPVRVEQTWRSVQLVGRLLQIATDTPSGKRFVMHIERVEEGRHKGAFQSFLSALTGP